MPVEGGGTAQFDEAQEDEADQEDETDGDDGNEHQTEHLKVDRFSEILAGVDTKI